MTGTLSQIDDDGRVIRVIVGDDPAWAEHHLGGRWVAGDITLPDGTTVEPRIGAVYIADTGVIAAPGRPWQQLDTEHGVWHNPRTLADRFVTDILTGDTLIAAGPATLTHPEPDNDNDNDGDGDGDGDGDTEAGTPDDLEPAGAPGDGPGPSATPNTAAEDELADDAVVLAGTVRLDTPCTVKAFRYGRSEQQHRFLIVAADGVAAGTYDPDHERQLVVDAATTPGIPVGVPHHITITVDGTITIEPAPADVDPGDDAVGGVGDVEPDADPGDALAATPQTGPGNATAPADTTEAPELPADEPAHHDVDEAVAAEEPAASRTITLTVDAHPAGDTGDAARWGDTLHIDCLTGERTPPDAPDGEQHTITLTVPVVTGPAVGTVPVHPDPDLTRIVTQQPRHTDIDGVTGYTAHYRHHDGVADVTITGRPDTIAAITTLIATTPTGAIAHHTVDGSVAGHPTVHLPRIGRGGAWTMIAALVATSTDDTPSIVTVAPTDTALIARSAVGDVTPDAWVSFSDTTGVDLWTAPRSDRDAHPVPLGAGTHATFARIPDDLRIPADETTFTRRFHSAANRLLGARPDLARHIVRDRHGNLTGAIRLERAPISDTLWPPATATGAAATVCIYLFVDTADTVARTHTAAIAAVPQNECQFQDDIDPAGADDDIDQAWDAADTVVAIVLADEFDVDVEQLAAGAATVIDRVSAAEHPCRRRYHLHTPGQAT